MAKIYESYPEFGSGDPYDEFCGRHEWLVSGAQAFSIAVNPDVGLNELLRGDKELGTAFFELSSPPLITEPEPGLDKIVGTLRFGGGVVADAFVDVKHPRELTSTEWQLHRHIPGFRDPRRALISLVYIENPNPDPDS